MLLNLLTGTAHESLFSPKLREEARGLGLKDMEDGMCVG